MNFTNSADAIKNFLESQVLAASVSQDNQQQKMKQLQDDPELRPVFEDLKQNGPDVIMKYLSDDGLMRKVSQKIGGINPTVLKQLAEIQDSSASLQEAARGADVQKLQECLQALHAKDFFPSTGRREESTDAGEEENSSAKGRRRADSGEETDCGETSSGFPSLEALDFEDCDVEADARLASRALPAKVPRCPPNSAVDNGGDHVENGFGSALLSLDADAGEENCGYASGDEEGGIAGCRADPVFVPFSPAPLADSRTMAQMLDDFAEKLDQEPLFDSEGTSWAKFETDSGDAGNVCDADREAEARTQVPTSVQHGAASMSPAPPPAPEAAPIGPFSAGELAAWLEKNTPEQYLKDLTDRLLKTTKAEMTELSEGTDDASVGKTAAAAW
jgi:hypothetical protein